LGGRDARSHHGERASRTAIHQPALEVVDFAITVLGLQGVRAVAPLSPRHPPAPLPRDPGQIVTTDQVITVRLQRRADAPVLRRGADLPGAITVPWWGNWTLRCEFA